MGLLKNEKGADRFGGEKKGYEGTRTTWQKIRGEERKKGVTGHQNWKGPNDEYIVGDKREYLRSHVPTEGVIMFKLKKA